MDAELKHLREEVILARARLEAATAQRRLPGVV